MKKFILISLFLIGCGHSKSGKPVAIPDTSRQFEVPETEMAQISSEKAAEIRKNPKTVQIADSINTVRLTCHGQGASLRYNPGQDWASCLVQNTPIFNVNLEDEVVVGIDTFYEGKTLEEVASSITLQLGESSYDEANKSHQWLYGNFALGVIAYDKGVRTRIVFIGDKHFPLSSNVEPEEEATPVIELDSTF